MYIKFFENESKVVIDKENGIISLKDTNYHFHAQDIQEGRTPIEMIKLTEICQILNIDEDSIPMEKLMECYAKLYEIIEFSYEVSKNEKDKSVLQKD
jgi:hypothetical protein